MKKICSERKHKIRKSGKKKKKIKSFKPLDFSQREMIKLKLNQGKGFVLHTNNKEIN